MTLEERVARGAALLDQECPGWVERIDLDRLSMGDCQRCILGQLYGDATAAPKEVEEWLDFGFDVLGDYGTLTKTWAIVIKQRRNSDAKEVHLPALA